MSSKEQQIRQFYLNKKCSANYVPLITTDEYWEYSQNQPYYAHFFKEYNYFRDGLKKVYNDDMDSFLKDWDAAIAMLTKLYKTVSPITHSYNNGAPPITIPDFIDGIYISLDVKNALIQSAIKEGIFTKEEYLNCFKDCKSMDFFASLKLPYCFVNNNFFLWNEYPSLSIDFPENNPYGLVARTPIGDNIIIKPHEPNIFQDKIDDTVRLQSGYMYHIEWVKKATTESLIGQISSLIYLNKKGQVQLIKAYLDGKKGLPSEFVPQLYKKLYNLPLEKFDLAFGTGNKIGYFPKPLFG